VNIADPTEYYETLSPCPTETAILRSGAFWGASEARQSPNGPVSIESLPSHLEQIKFLLEHSSIQTTERYLVSEQEIAVAVNDNLGL
jgi:hypothetical protein